MNLGKLTNIVFGAVNSRKDKTNKVTQLAMAINGTYVEDTVYVDDKVQWMFVENEGEPSVQHSNISNAVEKINSLESENVGLLLTEKLASKFSILAGLTGVTILDLSQKDVYDSHASHFDALGIDITGIVLVVSFVIGELDNNTKFTYSGVEYTLLPAEEEPEVDTLYSVDCQSVNNETIVTSSFNLGDSITIANNDSDISISPYALLLTSELAQNFSISVTGKTGVSQEDVDAVAATLQLMSYDSSGFEENATVSQFATEHNITHIWMMASLADCFGTEHEVISSATITYNGHTYVYDLSKVAIINNETEQLGE